MNDLLLRASLNVKQFHGRRFGSIAKPAVFYLSTARSARSIHSGISWELLRSLLKSPSFLLIY